MVIVLYNVFFVKEEAATERQNPLILREGKRGIKERYEKGKGAKPQKRKSGKRGQTPRKKKEGIGAKIEPPPPPWLMPPAWSHTGAMISKLKLKIKRIESHLWLRGVGLYLCYNMLAVHKWISSNLWAYWMPSENFLVLCVPAQMQDKVRLTNVKSNTQCKLS